MANQVVEMGSKMMCACLLLFQGLMMNTYLTKLYSPTWWSWIIADLAVLVIWVLCLWQARQRFMKKPSEKPSEWSESPNEIKYTYIGWLSYISLLCPRIGLIFHNLAKTLDERDVLGPNFLKMSVSCTPLIYFLLVYGSHNTESRTPRHLSVQGIAASGALDLFDSIDLLEFLFLPEEGVKCPPAYLHASLIFACVSMFLPVLSLYGLRFKTKPGRVSPLTFKICYEFLNLSLINIPNLLIRSVLWHRYSMDVSVLLMKNVMGIIAGVYELFEYLGEFRPIACKNCNDWFERHAYKKHKEACGQPDGILLTAVVEQLEI